MGNEREATPWSCRFGGKWKRGNSTDALAVHNQRQRRGEDVNGGTTGEHASALKQAPMPVLEPALLTPLLPRSGSALAGRTARAWPYHMRREKAEEDNLCSDQWKKDHHVLLYPISGHFFNHQFPIHREKVVEAVYLDFIKICCVLTRQWYFLAKDWKSDLALPFISFTEDETLWNNSWVYHSDGPWGQWWG